jgi:hypothetical protein
MTTTTLYITRRVSLPPRVAAAAFDAVSVANAERELTSWTVVAPSSVLVAKDCSLVGPEHWTLPIRRAEGRLRAPRRLGSYPVEVELVAWSREQAEVGVRPRGHWVPLADGPRQRRYFGLATAMAEHLAVTLEAAIAVWGYDVVRQAAEFVRATVTT